MPCCYRTLTAPKTPVPLPPAPAGDLPARLRRLRESLRLSKRAMAARLGFPEAAYLLWERGEHAPDLRAMPQVLVELGEAAPLSVGGSLGVQLKTWRVARGVSQAEAAGSVGIDVKTLGKIERNEYVSRHSAAAVEAFLLAAMHG